MNRTKNQRRAARLRYQVTVWFGEDTTKTGSDQSGNSIANKAGLAEGQMLDISSGGLAFRCKADENCPRTGQPLVTHFSIPSSGVQDCPSTMEFTRTGRVLRVQEVNPVLRNVAVQFDEPLPVGKVFFDTIGLYQPSQEGQAASTDDCAGRDPDPSPAVPVDARIKELEQVLAKLRKLQDAGHGTAE